MNFNAGDSIRITLTIKKEGVLFDPDTFRKITITHYSKGVVVNNITMDYVSQGVYRYDWITTSETYIGSYVISFKVQDGDYTTIKEDAVKVM